MSVELVGTAKVVDESGIARGGWVYQEAIWLGEELCECAENMTVMVEFQNETNLTATWATYFTTAYNYTAPNVSGQTYSFGQFNTEKACKTHFYIYPKAFQLCPDPCGAVDECGDPIISECAPDCDWTGSLEVRVKVTCATTGITYASDWQTINFVTPVEDYRHLAADKWQIISTPKALAGTGDLNFLLGTDKVMSAFYYNNGAWQSGAGTMLPLYSYYVRTAQADCSSLNATGYDANYVFRRTDRLSQTVPPTRTLYPGWNFASPGIAPDETECTTEPDTVYHWLGSACNLCKKVYNPGTVTGNLAPWTNLAIDDDAGVNPLALADMAMPVLNGDGYWLWISGTANNTLVADTATELLTQ
jgi:hypothetical protein